ncbi:MAG TPA: ABC transporter ATP-binding protein [Anaerolineales bacterium]|nr:ABC transporter ATP-binding protein [Anaerolineales bacterium]
MTGGRPVLQLVGVGKRFGGHPAVAGVVLDIPPNRIVAILGPSGCGKTTLLRLIAGLEAPDEGEIRIDGRVVAGRDVLEPPESRRVGMVFQHHALFPHMSVEQNIAFGLAGRHRAARAARVDHLLRLIGLPEARRRYPHELSGGQQQRVAVARALAPQPAVVLMDEPFSDLDAERRLRLRDEIRVILKQAGTTVVFVTHDQEEAIFMGDSLAIMRHGRLEQMGEAEAVFAAPASTFIAEFLGQTEFVPGVVESPSVLSTEIGKLAQHVDRTLGATVQVGFRADDVDFAPDPAGEAMLLARFFQGAVAIYRIRLASGRIVHSLQPHHRLHRAGGRVRVWLDPRHVLPCFDDGRAVPAWLPTETSPERAPDPSNG